MDITISDALATVMREANLPFTIEGVKKAGETLASIPLLKQTDLTRRLRQEIQGVIVQSIKQAGNILLAEQQKRYDKKLAEQKKCIDGGLDAKWQFHQKQEDEQSNKNYQVAVMKAEKEIEDYSMNTGLYKGGAKFKLKLLKRGLKADGIFVRGNLEELYRRTVNEMLAAKGLEFSL